MSSLKGAIEAYIHAKDSHRPHRIAGAFLSDATLSMTLKTDSIAFPSNVESAEGIAKVLVSQFAQQYENVYTFCIGSPPEDAPSFDCPWLVCMTEKSTGAARIGFGLYEWRYDRLAGKISKLRIVIEEMNTLPSDSSPHILDWAASLPYPWCPQDLPAQTAPPFPPVQRVVDGLQRLTSSHRTER